MFPIITKLSDLRSESIRNALEVACKNNLEDKIYFLPRPNNTYHFLTGASAGSAVFAGSAALAHLLGISYELWAMDSFTPNDTDMFILNRPQGGRHKNFLENIDIVHMTEKTVDELLMNFDLPICRVAMDVEYNIWVSAQALNAIITGEYYLPEYFNDESMFSKLLRQYQWINNIRPDAIQLQGIPARSHPVLHAGEKMLFERLQERIKKYQARGFTPRYVSTSEVMPWIKQRFCYVDWDHLVPLPVVDPTFSRSDHTHHIPLPKAESNVQLAPTIADALSRVVQDPTIQKLLVDIGLLKINSPPGVTGPTTATGYPIGATGPTTAIGHPIGATGPTTATGPFPWVQGPTGSTTAQGVSLSPTAQKIIEGFTNMINASASAHTPASSLSLKN